MPQSVRDQIMTAISDAKTSAERTMLLLMLQMYDLWAENTDTLSEVAGSVRGLKEAHFGIEPDTHREDHGVVQQIRASDRERHNDGRKVKIAIATNAIWAVIGGAVTTLLPYLWRLLNATG